MRIAAWNVRSFLAEEKKIQLTKEFERYKIDIGVLTEIRYAGSGVTPIRMNSPLTMIHSGAEKQGRNGVGIVMSPQAKRAWEETGGQWEAIDDRIVLARFRISGEKCLTVIGVYAPTDLADEETKIRFYQQLQKVKDRTPSRDILVIAGDFNARVGAENSGIEKVLGRCGLREKKNRNGEHLIHFATTNLMRIASTFYRHEKHHLGTWKEFGNDTVHQIDHILIQQQWAQCVEDIRVFRGANCTSDHYLLVATMKWKFQYSKKKQQATWKFRQLNEEQRKKYAQEVKSRLEGAECGGQDTVETKWRKIQTAVKESMQKAMEEVKLVKKNDWITDETLDLIEKQREVRKAWLQGRHVCTPAEWKEMKKNIKKSVKKDKRKFWEERAKKMEAAQNEGKAREVFEEVAKMRGKRKSGVERMRDKKGEMKSDTTQVAECITDYFQKLFNVDAKVDNEMEVPKVEGTEERWRELDAPPTEEEVAEKIRKLKNFKAGGPDDITAEALKWACEEKSTLSEIHNLIGEIWRTGEVPKDWGESVMVPLLKKGDPTNCDNYRGIALLSICGKVLTRIIADRIQKGYNDQMMEAQCGFRGGRSTTDQMFTLRQVVERRREYGLRSYVAFVDLKKAYDSVPRKLLFKVLRAEGIPEVMVRILESLYSRTTGRVRVKGMLGTEFDLRTGVRQGCVISPLLFNIYLNHILKRAERELKEKGLQFAFHFGRKLGPSGNHSEETLSLWGTLYADDIALLAASKEELQEMLTKIDTEFTRYGMTISAEKTKVMKCGANDELVDAMNIKIGDQKLEEVQSFKYVGGIITADGEMKEEIDQRMKAASMAFGGLRSQLFNDKKMAKGVKIRVYESLILAILLYGSETWNVRTTEAKKLETFHMNCLRCIAGKSRHEKIRNAIIRKSLKQITIHSNMRRRRLRWLGHVRRMEDGRWPKQMMYSWIEDCPRPKGKPKQRWRDVVNRDLKALGLKERWYELAAQREEWRAAIHKREQARFEEEERKEAEKIREFACMKCGTKCKSEKGLKGHMTRKHPFMCQKCGNEFDNHKSLSCHQATCKERKKEKEKEKIDDEWEYHGRRKQKEKPSSSSSASPDLPPTEFRCSLCRDFVAKTLTGLKSHLRHKHPDGKLSHDLLRSRSSLSPSSSSSVSPPPPPPAQAKNFQCRFCSFTCAAKIGIWKHEQTQHQPSMSAASSSSPPTTADSSSSTRSTNAPTSDLSVPSSLTKGPSPPHRPPDDDSPPG